MPEHQKQKATVAGFVPAALNRLDQPFNLAPRQVLAVAVFPRPCFRFCVRSSFCREFSLCDAPETRIKRAWGFWNIDKMFHFVESDRCAGFLQAVKLSVPLVSPA